MAKGKHSNLHNARAAKNDEFYTQLSDIDTELYHYKSLFRGKTVLCNCDDPYESNFFKYFASKFIELGLRKLICTSYAASPVAGTKLRVPVAMRARPENEQHYAYKCEITEVRDENGDGTVDIEDVEIMLERPGVVTILEGDGDFRSPECITLLEEADIVVTNPPFSLFREFVALLMKHQKQFIILGNMNAVTYKEIFPYIAANQIWYGPSIVGGDRKFNVPESYPLEAATCGVDESGRKFVRVKGVRWFTNMDHSKRHEPLDLVEKYTPKKYPHYDNYDAINVDKTREIPCDYDGVIGVPITFLDKYCPEQFEIIGLGNGTELFTPTKIYQNAVMHKNGKTRNGNAINRVLVYPCYGDKKVYYTAENAEGELFAPYARILVRRKPTCTT